VLTLGKGTPLALHLRPMQFPGSEAGAHVTTANKAIELAQKDIVTAFVRHRAPN